MENEKKIIKSEGDDAFAKMLSSFGDTLSAELKNCVRVKSGKGERKEYTGWKARTLEAIQKTPVKIILNHADGVNAKIKALTGYSERTLMCKIHAVDYFRKKAIATDAMPIDEDFASRINAVYAKTSKTEAMLLISKRA